jgi:hypothetical protein
MKILVTGSEGSLVTPHLSGRGHEITGLDTGFNCEGNLYPSRSNIPPP